MPEVVDMLDDDSNDGGVTIDLLSLDSDDEVQIVETSSNTLAQEKCQQKNNNKRRKQPNQARSRIGSNSTNGDDDGLEVAEQTPNAQRPPQHSVYPAERQAPAAKPTNVSDCNGIQKIQPETDPKRDKDGNQWMQKTMARVRKEQAKFESVAIVNTFKISAAQTLSLPPKATQKYAYLSSTLLGLSPEQEKSLTEDKASSFPVSGSRDSLPKPPKPRSSDYRQAKDSDLKRRTVEKRRNSTRGEEDVDVPCGNDDTEKALQMSRDRQYAIFLNQKWNNENPTTRGTFSRYRKSPTKEVIDLLDDDGSDSDSTRVGPEQYANKSSEKEKKTTGEGKGGKQRQEAKQKGKLIDHTPLYHGLKKQMEADSYGLSTESSSDGESESSQWIQSNRNKAQRKRRDMHERSTSAKKSKVRGLQRATPSFSEPQPFDFTGKEISKKRQRHQSFDERESRQVSIETGDVESNNTASHHHPRASNPISTENTISSMSLDNPVHQRKPPPPLADSKAAEHTIVDIVQKIHRKDKVKKQNILRNTLLRHKTRTQQLPSTRTIFPRVAPNSTKRKDEMKYNRPPSTTDGHTAIINSSLTVLTTVNDSKTEEETEQNRVHENAQALSLMPHEFKCLQRQCTDILNELPFNQRYHPQVHELVSEKLYTAPKKSKAKLEIPIQFKYAPDLDYAPPTIKTRTNCDKSNEDYVSVMKSFRDFCVQCKTFDCQNHITNYPDAATQACVAFQYDKRALLRKSRMPFQLNHKDPYSYLIPTTEGSFVLFNGGNFDVFDKPPSLNVINSNGSKRRISFENGSRICPFCTFNCHTQERLYKHLARYHQDTFYCKEVGSTFEATERTQAKETMISQREYFHSRSLIPIQSGHYDRDSDDESDYSWYHDYRKETMDELTDVSDKEKRIQTSWNRYIGCSPVIIPDKYVPKLCFLWIWKHHMEMDGIEWELYQLLITFWERRLLNVSHIEKLIHLLHIKRNGAEQNQDPLTPRQRVIFSRLHLIFKSFCGNPKPRLRKALRINPKGNIRILRTPVLPEHLWPKWTKNRTITVAIRMRSEDAARPFFFPCHHTGKCSIKNGCTCIENDYVCTKHCVWGKFGDNFFPGCNCKGDCSIAKNCPCRDVGRECDPDICGCAASTDDCLKTCGCSNMDVSLAKKASLVVGQSEVEGAGLGLFTKYPLKKGDYIDEVGT